MAAEIIVYGDVRGQYKDFSPEFKRIVSRSVDSLRRFEVSKRPGAIVPARATLKDKLAAARKNKLSWVADAHLTSEKRKANLVLEIYNAFSGEKVFRWSKQYKIRNIRATFSRMQYEMPVLLKNRFMETGRVIKTTERTVFFDLGDAARVRVGEIFQVYVEGMEIRDNNGNLFGYVEDTKGVVKVIEVNPVYSVAEIMLGGMNIKAKQLIKKIPDARAADYVPEILSVMENEVAINIGKNVGVREGSYYSIYRDVEKINSREAFRKPVGIVKINEVFDTFSKGELSISDNFEISKYTMKKGDRVIEVESPRKTMWSANQLLTNISSAAPESILYAAIQRDSAVNVDLSYRLKAGYGTELYFAGGVMHALSHSDKVFAGLDVAWIGSTAINVFLSVDVNTPLSRYMKLNLESGYTVSATNDAYNGINTSLGIKYGWDLF